MKVIFLSHMFPNLLAPYTTPFMVERAKALSREVDLKIVAPVSYFPVLRTKLPNVQERFSGLEVVHPRFIALPFCLWKYRWIPYFFMLKRLSCADFFNPSILHIEWIYPDAYAAVQYAKLRGMKTVGVVHGNEAIEYFGPRRFHSQIRKVVAELDRIIVVSRDLKNKLVQEYSVSEDKVTIILNGVDLHNFPMIEQKAARSRLKLAYNDYFGIVVARLSSEKNLDILLQAIARMGRNAPCIRIIGDGPEKKKLESLLMELQIAGKVQLIGELPHKDIAVWLNAADFFCLPSQREGCPVVIHEALACGVPVIATTVGAIPDLIKSKEYGLLCPPADISALAESLGQVRGVDWDHEKIARYGRTFTWDKVAAQTVKVFQEVTL